jgi:polyhydroxyalkanoate synthesis regulator phasin
VAQINNLDLELRSQEIRARQDEEAACMHEWSLAKAQVDEVRKELSNRINELEAQQSGQISTSEDPESQPRSTRYYCDDCSYLQMKLREAKQKSRDLDDKCDRRKYQILVLEDRLDNARDDSARLREDLNAANENIARLLAKLGLRTSKS